MKKLLLILVLASSFAMAQGPHGQKGRHGECPFGDQKCEKMSKGPRFEKLFDMLKLDSLKRVEVKAILTEFHKERTLLKLESDEHEIALKKMILKDQFDMDLIKKNCNTRGDIWAKIQIKQFEKDAKIKKLLTKEQWDMYLMHRVKMLDKKEQHGKAGENKKGAH